MLTIKINLLPIQFRLKINKNIYNADNNKFNNNKNLML